ncbi:uncharacterized protein LOC132248682 [Alligator mississippiensis]|uniref:uncharacterized protein LOC132248682 n=1 Tax=Alligator mississippiensis TaxID=8496 RepID=UPI002877D0DD|nr:uncharacterized protein LOC132248682 [Alligator mississippiensis]
MGNGCLFLHTHPHTLRGAAHFSPFVLSHAHAYMGHSCFSRLHTHPHTLRSCSFPHLAHTHRGRLTFPLHTRTQRSCCLFLPLHNHPHTQRSGSLSPLHVHVCAHIQEQLIFPLAHTHIHGISEELLSFHLCACTHLEELLTFPLACTCVHAHTSELFTFPLRTHTCTCRGAAVFSFPCIFTHTHSEELLSFPLACTCAHAHTQELLTFHLHTHCHTHKQELLISLSPHTHSEELLSFCLYAHTNTYTHTLRGAAHFSPCTCMCTCTQELLTFLLHPHSHTHTALFLLHMHTHAQRSCCLFPLRTHSEELLVFPFANTLRGAAVFPPCTLTCRTPPCFPGWRRLQSFPHHSQGTWVLPLPRLGSGPAVVQEPGQRSALFGKSGQRLTHPG